jgi:hypothetical protein
VQPPTIQLKETLPFSQGGNRLCFVHPDNPDRCLKVLTEASKPERRRAEKGLLGRLRPLHAFDENQQEHMALNTLWSQFNESVTCHLPKTYGIPSTDMGPAHEMDLIRDEDGRIAQTLEQYLWNIGRDEPLKQAIDTFCADWLSNAPNTRALLPHNIVIQSKNLSLNLVLIDGYGRNPASCSPRVWHNWRTQSIFEQLNRRVETVLQRKQNDEAPKPRISILKRSL